MSGTPQGQHGQHARQEFDGWADGAHPGQYADGHAAVDGYVAADGYAEGYVGSAVEGGYAADAYPDGYSGGGSGDGYAAAGYDYEGHPQQVPTLPDARPGSQRYDTQQYDTQQYDSGGFPQQYAQAYEQQQYEAAAEPYAGEPYAGEAFAAELYVPYAPGGGEESAYGHPAPVAYAPYEEQAGGDRRLEGFDTFDGAAEFDRDAEFDGADGYDGGVMVEVGAEFDARAGFGDSDVLDAPAPFDARDERGETSGRGRRGKRDDYAEVPAPGRQAAERAARRVPIWHPPGLLPALLTSGLAGALVVGALVGGPAIVVSVAVLQVVTAAGWFRLHGMWPARQGIALAILAGFAADVAVLKAGDDALGILPGILAAVLGVVLLQQLARRDGRPELLPALTVTASAALLTVLDVLFVLAARVESPDVRDGALVVVGAAAVAVAVLPAAMPLPGPLGAALGLAAAAVAGLVAGSVLNVGGTAVALGVGAGVMGLLGRRTAGYDHPSKFVHFTAGVALPLALAAPAVYLLGRAALG
ncbi:hypothetical protein [Streptodolium elevatio]